MTEQKPALTVMTYNVGNGLAPPARLVEFLRRADTDLIGLQEVDAAQAAAIASELAEDYPHQVLAGTGFSGRGLLSRLPIVEHEQLHLSPERPDLRAVVEFGGQTATILVAHPPPPRLSRQGMVFDLTTIRQIEQLAVTAVETAPAVLLGDFNMTTGNPIYAWLESLGLVDAFTTAGVGRGVTFPVRLGKTRRVNHRLSWVPLPPMARIDYIWHSGNLTSLAAWVESGAGSDHRPVLARLSLPVVAGETEPPAILLPGDSPRADAALSDPGLVDQYGHPLPVSHSEPAGDASAGTSA
jgi:endonuclease/exonuclease/phosphatase family metal-dependent hydrolase